MTGYRVAQNYHGRQLQRELRKLRLKAGLTLEQAGERAHIDFKKLSRMEIHQLPTYHELVMLLDVYDVVSRAFEPYLTRWELAKKLGWWRQYTRSGNHYLRMEDEAAVKTEFQLGFLPTLLQTESYAQAALATAFDNDKAVNNLVALRMRQQERLFSADRKLQLHALIHQPTLHQGVDKAQLRNLVERAELPNVQVQVVPHSRGLHLGLRGSAILLSFDDADEPDIVFTETHLGLSECQEPEEVSAIKRMLDRVTAHALTPADSTSLIHKMIAAHR